MAETMHAVTWNPAARAYEKTEGPAPAPGPNDLLVAVGAAAVNPVDAKMQGRIPADAAPRPLGYDACGRVRAVGDAVAGFAPGDRVFYAGAADRPGAFATHQLVDHRLVAHAPERLEDADAAALPLTAITAWEALFDRLGYTPLSHGEQPERLLLINGAGGVGSVALQLAKLSGIHATATASRAETREWCARMGAAEVVGHSAVHEMPDAAFERILCAHDTDRYFAEMARLVAPEGRIVSIVGTQEKHDLAPLFQKSASFGWEFMFTRPVQKTPDMARQGEILAAVARLCDDGKLQTTRTATFEGLTVETIEAAQAKLAEGRQIGKIALVW
ncbi:zinc-binding alcohol dehydrogenase family protein [Rhodosalinus sediminis]|jgi:zinc-binding alcohol dehydrogenase family protein|uniref:zinc-binding alcohol dehydrogenase family protein n=1 Tax=Rhodosalinus sediminis TaxID=1940533 RepID=UPI0023525449|nr:zinc-binding alcohol dehydrogenase family protein [Rhodosalinus sediminis]